jgi:hypothetical protein
VKNVLYDVEWQALRVSLLATNAKGSANEGGFATVPGTQKNLEMLNKYFIDGASVSTDEAALRVWRILNLLNATRMGYSGQGRKGSTQDVLVQKFRDRIQEFYDGSRVSKLANNWDWDKVAMDLSDLKRSNRTSFDAIYRDVKKRAVGNEARGGDNLANRADLLKFIGLMEEV